MTILPRSSLSGWLLACVAIAGCSWQEPPGELSRGGQIARPEPAPVKRTQPPLASDVAVATALAQVGVPYRYGGESPSQGFDCSGLVWFAYRSAGVTPPRTTAGLWRELPAVPRGYERPGDLVFFNIDGKPQHVGIFIGDGRFVHAPSTGKSVAVASLDAPYYRRARLRSARVVAE